MQAESARAEVVATLRAAGCVFAEEEADLLLASSPHPDDLAPLLARRAAGEPLEHLLGWVAFAGLRLHLEPGVFVPRRRTELLVRAAAQRLRPGDVLVDLCCGCGAVAAAVESRVPGIAVYAVDVDPVAAACARRNLRRPDRVLIGDLFDPLPPQLRGRVAVLTANAPYVPTGALGTMPAEARLHEPRMALDGGAEGVTVQARILAAAADWLSPSGAVLVETGRDLAAGTAGLIRAATGPALTVTTLWDDGLEATVVAGERIPG